MSEVRVLINEDKDAMMALNELTYKTLENEAFFIPFEENEIDDLLKEESKGELLGIFEENKLIAVAGLLTELDDFADDIQKLGHEISDVVEIGGLMTRSEARGKGYVSMMNKMLVERARDKGFTQMIATVHPDNIASDRTLQKIGMEYIEAINRHGKLRKFYIKAL